MDDFHNLSDDAKHAWQRGYDLAHPRFVPGRSKESRDCNGDARDDDLTRAVDAVGDTLQGFAENERKSFMAVKTDSGVNLVVMDPVSVEAVIVELDNMKTNECREALGDGFLKGMISKAKVAKLATADADAPTLN